jgi:hypothetical protein
MFVRVAAIPQHRTHAHKILQFREISARFGSAAPCRTLTPGSEARSRELPVRLVNGPVRPRPRYFLRPSICIVDIYTGRAAYACTIGTGKKPLRHIFG